MFLEEWTPFPKLVKDPFGLKAMLLESSGQGSVTSHNETPKLKEEWASDADSIELTPYKSFNRGQNLISLPDIQFLHQYSVSKQLFFEDNLFKTV